MDIEKMTGRKLLREYNRLDNCLGEPTENHHLVHDEILSRLAERDALKTERDALKKRVEEYRRGLHRMNQLIKKLPTKLKILDEWLDIDRDLDGLLSKMDSDRKENGYRYLPEGEVPK